MSVYPAWSTGDILSASRIRQSRPQLIQTTTIQTYDSSKAGSVVDNELFFYAETNANYFVSVHLLFSQITNSVIINPFFSTPNNSTRGVQSYGSTDFLTDFTSRTDTNLSFVSTTFPAHRLGSDGLDAAVWINATFVNTSVPGFISLNWGPQSTVAGTITRDAGSVMTIIRFS